MGLNVVSLVIQLLFDSFNSLEFNLGEILSVSDLLSGHFFVSQFSSILIHGLLSLDSEVTSVKVHGPEKGVNLVNFLSGKDKSLSIRFWCQRSNHFTVGIGSE